MARRSTRSSAAVKAEPVAVKQEKDVKAEPSSAAALATPPPSPKKAANSSTAAKKLAHLAMYRQTPFPEFERPTAQECQEVHDLLSSVHGKPQRPSKLVDKPAAGCGDTPDVLDALIRTVLSANTSSRNSTAAKKSMDERFGRANHRAVLEAPVEELRDAIACGGLANVKSKTIHKILIQVDEKQGGKGQLSLDWLHEMSDLDAMRELLSFDGVGPKTASCVLLFCLGRESFAVDTHVFRITSSLGWIPKNANRETTFQHLDVRIPDELKYGLHSLLVRHGRSCPKCSANGVTSQQQVECPIGHLVRRSKAKSATPKKANAAKQEDDEEEEGEEQVKEEEEATPTRKRGKKASSSSSPKQKRAKVDFSVDRDEAEMGGHMYDPSARRA